MNTKMQNINDNLFKILNIYIDITYYYEYYIFIQINFIKIFILVFLLYLFESISKNKFDKSVFNYYYSQ